MRASDQSWVMVHHCLGTSMGRGETTSPAVFSELPDALLVHCTKAFPVMYCTAAFPAGGAVFGAAFLVSE